MDMDKAKDMLEGAKEKASDLAEKHGDKIEGGIDKAVDFLQSKTPESMDDKIEKAGDAVKGLLDKLDGDDDGKATKSGTSGG